VQSHQSRNADHVAQAAGGTAPAGWTFDKVSQLQACELISTCHTGCVLQSDWWLEEHGLVMEKPSFPLPAGKYMVTGDREVTTELTVSEDNKWSLKQGVQLHLLSIIS
jgi:hypothetical protein